MSDCRNAPPGDRAPLRAFDLPAADVSLLLRAHAEQRWLSREVTPVVRQLQSPQAMPAEQLGAGLAYLEVIWLDARLRARETDQAYERLLAQTQSESRALAHRALRYYGSVKTLREAVARRAMPLLADVPPYRAPSWA